jgi:peptide/nickel transport system permease protein
VAELILQRLALTVPLALLAMTAATALALALGVYAAARHNRPGDWAVMGFAQLGVAVPSFWFGILLILLFSVELKWFKSGGFPGWDAGFWEALQALALPALALALFQAAVLARITRGAVLDAMREDWVRTARAKGLSKAATLLRHVLRNAMIPVVTVMGLQFANLLTGAVVIENVFALPGLGRLIFQAISNRDLIVVENATLLLATMVVAVNFAVDLLYAAIDPRVKAQH